MRKVIRCRAVYFELHIFSIVRDDWVKIHDGGNEGALPIGGAMCGYNPPTEIISSSNELLIKFHTDADGSDSGYKIKIEKGYTIV